MEDSMGALYFSYEVLKDRYNKLKSQYRTLALSKTCCHCSGSLDRKAAVDRNLHLDLNHVSQVKSFETPVTAQKAVSCTSPATAELIREVTHIREKLARALSNSSDESDYSCLSNAFASLCELQKQISPEQNNTDKFQLSSADFDTPVSCGDSRSKPSRARDVHDIESSHASDSVADYDLWIDAINSVNERATSQHDKLEDMYKKVCHQSHTLQTLIARWNELVSTTENIPVHGENNDLNFDDWSIVPS